MTPPLIMEKRSPDRFALSEAAAPKAQVRRGSQPPRFNDGRLPSPIAAAPKCRAVPQSAAAVLRSLGEGGAGLAV